MKNQMPNGMIIRETYEEDNISGKVFCKYCDKLIGDKTSIPGYGEDKIYACEKCYQVIFQTQKMSITTEENKTIKEIEEKKIAANQIEQKVSNAQKIKKTNLCFCCDQQVQMLVYDTYTCRSCFILSSKYEERLRMKKRQPQNYGLAELFKEEAPVQKQPCKIKTRSKAVKKTKENQKKESYCQKQCKLCMNAESTMMNHKCRHLLMCQACFQKYRIKQGDNQKIPCPLCKVVGDYSKYIPPIYS